MSDSVRSIIPINNITSNGRHTDTILLNENLYHQSPYPCGVHSPWNSLQQLSAQILFINVSPVHSCTLIHVAEDLFCHEYSRYNWYWERHFELLINGNLQPFFSYERHPKVSMSYCESKFSHDLKSSGLLHEFRLGELYIGLIDSKELLNFIRSKRFPYPYYGIKMSLL